MHQQMGPAPTIVLAAATRMRLLFALAMASVVLTQQNSMAAAVIVIHFILNVSWNDISDIGD